jgi:metallophosphoesterase superfamily enzyme
MLAEARERQTFACLLEQKNRSFVGKYSNESMVSVISDLHVSEGLLEDFDTELEGHLLTFLDWFGQRPEPSELVINGDFLDFVQASPWSGADLEDSTIEGIPLCFSKGQSLQKLGAIQIAHPLIFSALRTFLASNRNRLGILPGNHDADFFWPKVREQFASTVSPNRESDQLVFCLDRA